MLYSIIKSSQLLYIMNSWYYTILGILKVPEIHVSYVFN